MRIEKLNDNQIRCTLTKDDLATRQIKLSELAYGTEKAKELFRDMMQQASVDFGFEADNIPLMIEAIPLPNECIVLIITKVEDPEELDTRFSKFAPGSENHSEELNDLGSVLPEGADNVLDMFRKLIERHLKEGNQEEQEEKAIALASELDLTRLYFFPDLDTVISAAHVLNGYYAGQNSLYRLIRDGSYCLVDEKGRWTVYAGCDREYAEQVTAEHKVNVKKGGRTTQEWVQKHSHGDNHYLDCEVYAAAAADVMEVRSLVLQNPGQGDQQQEKPAQPARQAETIPEENWLGTHEDWI